MRAGITAAAVLLISSPAWGQVQPSDNPAVTIERVESRFVIVPEAKLTDLDGELGNLVGFTAGWLHEETLLVGGAGYWLTGANDWDVAYGGLVVGMQWRGDRAVTFGTRGLLGIGEATRTVSIRQNMPWPFAGSMAFWPGVPFQPMPARWQFPIGVASRDVRMNATDNFLVFEPQANVMFTVTRRIRFGVSGGYRFTGSAGAFGDDLNGVTGTLSIQFGVGGNDATGDGRRRREGRRGAR